MNTSKILIYSLFIAAVFLWTGCEENTVQGLNETPFIIGEITDIKKTDNQGYWILVSEHGNEQEDEAKFAWFGLTSRTEILKRKGDGTLVGIDTETVEVGQVAEAWWMGAYDLTPYQGEARRLVVIDG